MSGFPILDLVAGTIFIFFLLSIICSSAVEIVLTMGKFRARILEKWLLTIFNKPVGTSTVTLGQAIMDHCSTTALSKAGHATSYIDARNFTAALLEKLTFDPMNPKSIATDINGFIASIRDSTMLPHELQGVLLGYAMETKDTYQALTIKVSGEIEMFKAKIEKWYDTNMDRVSGSLKANYTRKFTFWIAFSIAVGLNADTIGIAKYLYKNPDARTQLVKHAYAAAGSDSVRMQVERIVTGKNRPADSAQAKELVDSITARIADIKLTKNILEDAIPLGWNSHVFEDDKGKFCWLMIPSKMAGLAVTILAIMMGAPFWFDVLNRIANLRGAGTKPASQADPNK